MMKKSSKDKELTTQCQFDSFCKVVLRNQARDIYRTNKRMQEKFVSLSSLTPSELNQFSTMDSYETDYFHFSVNEFDISVENMLIAEALEQLPKKKQDILLLSFFMDMSDVAIAKEMNLDDSTIRYHKHDALRKIKKYMEEKIK